MKIRVKYFAMCQEIVGKDGEEIQLSENADTEMFWEYLTSRYPDLAPYRKQSRLAVNLNYVLGKVPLTDGDEVCIIPPVSGG